MQDIEETLEEIAGYIQNLNSPRSLRDKVAGQVLVRLLPDGGWQIYPSQREIEEVSKLSYAFADAMIAARDA